MSTNRQAYRELAGRISRAQARFDVSALATTFGALRGPALSRTLAREANRRAAFEANSRARIRRDVREAAASGLSPGEQSARLEAIARRERHYLAQHLDESARRIRLDGEMAHLKAIGESGAVWVLGNRRRHTADCLRMANRWWPWDVLDRVNPANRHAGCGCRLTTKQEARAVGVVPLRGRYTPSLDTFTESAMALYQGAVISVESDRVADLRESDWTDEEIVDLIMEAIDVPIHVGAYIQKRRGKPVHVDAHVKTISVDGDLPKTGEIGAALKTMLAATATGRREHITDAHADLRAAVLRQLAAPNEKHDAPLKKRIEKAEKAGRVDKAAKAELAANIAARQRRSAALRTVDRIHGEALRPQAGRPVPGRDPLVPTEKEGITGAWADGGVFRWEFPQGSLGTSERVIVESFTKSPDFRVTTKAGRVSIATRKGRAEASAQRSARKLERELDVMRKHRSVADGKPFRDTRPLDMHEEDPMSDSVLSGAEWSKYHLISWGQQGDAAEAGIEDVMRRLMSLKRRDGSPMLLPDAKHRLTNAQGQVNDAADWIIGADSEVCYYAEVKSHGWRGLVGGRAENSGPSVTKEQSQRKRDGLAELNAERARRVPPLPKAIPVVFQVWVDFDADVMHVTMQNYNPRIKDKLFVSKRVPGEVTTGIIDGTIKPGTVVAPARGSHGGNLAGATTYVGSFPLRFNPLGDDKHTGQRLSDLTPAEKRALVSRPMPQVDAFEGDPVVMRRKRAPEPKPKGRAAIAARNKEIIDEARRMAKGKSAVTQEELGERFGISQPTISGIIANHNKDNPKDQIVIGKGKRTDRQPARRARK